MIRLHSPFERVVMVSPERITHVKPDHERPEQTRVYFDDDYITVRESIEEVARKVLEWRLAMERYRAALITEKKEIALAEYQLLKGDGNE